MDKIILRIPNMTLRFVFAHAHSHFEEIGPVRKRVVTVELTPEQLVQLQPLCVDSRAGWYDELYEVIAEPVYEQDHIKRL